MMTSACTAFKTAPLLLALPLAACATHAQLSSLLPPDSGKRAAGKVGPWSVLTDVKTRNEKNCLLPVFNECQLGRDGRTQRIQGFMMPQEPGKKPRHFLLPGGPESMVEVKTRTPVKYGMEVEVVEGRLQVQRDDPYGLSYRISDAVTVK